MKLLTLLFIMAFFNLAHAFNPIDLVGKYEFVRSDIKDAYDDKCAKYLLVGERLWLGTIDISVTDSMESAEEADLEDYNTFTWYGSFSFNNIDKGTTTESRYSPNFFSSGGEYVDVDVTTATLKNGIVREEENGWWIFGHQQKYYLLLENKKLHYDIIYEEDENYIKCEYKRFES